MKRVVISVSNDLVTDQRVQRTIAVLKDQGYEVNFVGRKLPDSADFKPDYQYHRFHLNFHKGFLFYAQLNIWLFFYLLFKKPYDLYWSNDLDTLLPNYLVSKIFRRPLIYDSHEYFCGVPEIQDRPLVKKVWQSLEAAIFPKLKWIITVNESIANLYERDYGIRPKVLRNIGDSYLPKSFKTRTDLDLPSDVYLVVNQGAGINVDRGMEEFMETLAILDSDIHLMVVGKGDVIPALKERAQSPDLSGRVHFINPMPYREMLHFTAAADLGISLDKDTNLNYRYSLPNKLFDYIKCGVPILCSEVVEVKGIVQKFEIGRASAVEPESLKEALLSLRAKGKSAYTENLKRAAKANNWESEKEVIISLLSEIDQ